VQVVGFLMDAKLADARPLINVCDRFDRVTDLTKFLYENNLLRCAAARSLCTALLIVLVYSHEVALRAQPLRCALLPVNVWGTACNPPSKSWLASMVLTG
jgi:hypothetical protein